jgi:hypothetical protein
MAMRPDSGVDDIFPTTESFAWQWNSHNPKQASGIKEVHRVDADWAGAAEGSGGHGWAGERHHRHAPTLPAKPCGTPSQAGWKGRSYWGIASEQVNNDRV